MTRIRATCPACGEVDLRPHDIELEIIRDVFEDVGDGSCYRFACPACTEVVTKPADDRIAKLLTTGGVHVVVHEELLPEPHPEAPPTGPRFDLDDLIRFHQLLESDHWFQELRSTSS